MTNAEFIVTCLLEDLEPTAQWPEDFQVILSDYLEQLGYDGLPDAVPVKTVPVDPYIGQAMAMEYAPGDERRHSEYLADLQSYYRGGGDFPPIIVDGDRLIDGRHRLLAMAGVAHVQAIDLKDLRRL